MYMQMFQLPTVKRTFIPYVGKKREEMFQLPTVKRTL